ncbi:hypothetical protein HMPREF1544_09090 [Mucor circinelloides 1006PhL]|uniref:Uncharacterized protein n=1 Tax=Mucor circinelloides f. circinelloides (strain 1006PhL) TaxID=1220926 RepID=S2JNI4_MUCC1|nr:hypothetical protein HMPREF1544_09090 [Mucor circinelloides 1006PhL]
MEKLPFLPAVQLWRFWHNTRKVVSENSAGFLKRTAVIRENKSSITKLKDPDTGEICRDQHGTSTIANNVYYITLFTPHPADSITLSTLIQSIPSHLKLSNDQQESLMLPIDIEELLEDSKHTRRLSSPGLLAYYYIDPRSPRGSSVPGFSQCLLWLAHMRFIYDKTPIDRTAILASIRNNARQTINKGQCHSLL